ncbi:voltage-gated hydrogen channel 1 [Brachionus plicatilis]|uniref:Voltage-gated hydrogen channel 1 n=1 Tax=Brachionus plicatilis TaxID=10195 RepID=A0A3M7PZ67_BRAPC|nr:voltage-gated hydrogen channel 1 [Brachionus plicatilis]
MWRYARISEELDSIFESAWFSYVVSIMTILDAICIITVIVIEYIMLSLIHRDFLLFQKYIAEGFYQNSSQIVVYLNKTLTKAHETRSNFEVGHIILSVVILTILSLFIMEMISKLIFTPRMFLKRKLEILEAIIIVISFGLDLTLVIGKSDIASIVSLVTLIRLWRVGLVLDVFLTNKHITRQKKIHSLKTRRNELKTELESLKQIKERNNANT